MKYARIKLTSGSSEKSGPTKPNIYSLHNLRSLTGTGGMNPSDIPQFEEGDREAIARPLLDKEGLRFASNLDLNRMSDTISGVKDYEFTTILC